MSDVASILPPDEQERLAAVRRYDVLDTPPDGAFDRVTRLASTLLDMPIAIVSIVDTDRIWFKSAYGLDGVDEIGRDAGLCASAILQEGPWIVGEAHVDPRTLANPLVSSDFGLRFYAGVPLTTNDGFNLGTLCVIDKEPRELPPNGEQILADLAAIVVDELELRLAARAARDRVEGAARRATELNDDVVQGLTLAKLQLELGEHEAGITAVSSALTASRRILDELSEDAGTLRRMADVRL
ncbi:MAG: multi-sensor hybrid histidine kinase [Thermoleophilia bacterium]|nr:multi-sensor hybrid histidine kinase [Thermoleophilia bacterium]